MQSKFLSLLGMARRANRIRMGYDKAIDAIHSDACFSVFCANDLSEKTKRGLVFAAEDTDIKIIDTKYSMYEISNAVGSKTGVVAVCDSGFSKRLIELLKQEQ
ncbi:MAG: ribosomal L7Ae/L30e/S12e/Gadd45 family protein [Clostridia bacterium]|nr:ribosomal L7Ae/L30e/S12e/Gadd45 family protein [Clostridia bacterium]MEE1024600.1 ribosomal L7Ae/L30e/S12e/Gadd45 family protein [Acutalibacteraceae bacterium]